MAVCSTRLSARLGTARGTATRTVDKCAVAGGLLRAISAGARSPKVKVTQNREANLQISAFARGKQWQSALLLFQKMKTGEADAGLGKACLAAAGEASPPRVKSVAPRVLDVVSYNATISSCQSGPWQVSVYLLQEMMYQRVWPNIISYNATLSSCEKGNQWQLAFHLFSSMEISPDLVTCNTLISACARETRWPDAINLLTSMEGRRVLPDLISFKTAITSCRKEGRWEEALELLSLMWQQRVAIDLITMNSAMTCTASAQQWKEVMVLFDSMRICKLSPDRLSYSTAMSACESWQRVLESLQNMLKLGVVDVTSWSSLLQTCREQREVGVSIIEALGMSQQDVVLTSATMDFWARIHQWAKALQLFTAMPHARIRPNVSDFTMAMLACSQSRLWQRALQLFRRMKDDLEGNLNIIAYNTAMGACSNGQWSQCLELLRDLHETRVSANLASFISCIAACQEEGEWEMACSLLFQDIILSSLKPNILCYTFAMNTCLQARHWQGALSTFANLSNQTPEMTSAEPDLLTFKMAIRACGLGSEWSRAIIYFERMMDMQIPPDTDCYMQLLDSLHSSIEQRRFFYKQLSLKT